jgi:hypothetical protein
MKIKLPTNRIMAILFLVIMVGSTASFAVIQSYNSGATTQQNPNGVPKTSIINYDVSSNVYSAFISAGYTVVKFYYNDACTACLTPKSTFENLALNNKNQVLLEELISTNETVPHIVVSSYKDSITLNQPSADDITNALCDLMASPPATLKCALRNM